MAQFGNDAFWGDLTDSLDELKVDPVIGIFINDDGTTKDKNIGINFKIKRATYG
jgi:hypothetical protein